MNLHRVQYYIDLYDSDFFYLLKDNYESIFELFYEATRKQNHDIELTKFMTQQEINNELYRTVNYDKIIEKTKFMTSDLRERANKLKKEIALHYLNN